MGEIADKLIRLIATKEDLILQVLYKTVDQQLALSEDNIDKLLEITEEKQSLIDNYKSAHNEFEVYYLEFKKHNKFYEAIDTINKINDNIHQAFEKINTMERENRIDLEQRMDVLKQHVKQVNTDKKAYNAYYQMGIWVSEFIDQRN